MSDINTPAAFPTPGKIELRDIPGKGGTKYEHKIPSKNGMDLRDYFAAQIAAGDAASENGWPDGITVENAKNRARMYFRVADAMMAVRNEADEKS